MKKIAIITLKSVYGLIDPFKRDNSFEIFGLDYMIDEDFKVYLIEVNTNPCLELSCNLLARIIPNMIENALRSSISTSI
jgi:tubulin polyglutamylase TTLL1